MTRFSVQRFLFQPVDIAPLVFFRIAFGFLMAVESIGAIFDGFVHEAYIHPQFHFTYLPFQWLEPLPGSGMVLLYLFMGVLGLMITVGWWYRTACALFFLCFSWGFLLEKAHYINHHYLAILYAFLLIFMPANRYFSVDGRKNPSIRTDTIPYWPIFLLVAQMALVYVYAALAKIYPDWLAAKPLLHWFGPKADYPLVGYFFQFEATAWAFAYGGILFDLLIVPAMLWKKTRPVAFVVAVVFHLSNLVVFHIGIFPFLAIALTALFFPSHHFRRWMFPATAPPARDPQPLPSRRARPIVAFCAMWLFVQALLPLRPYLYNADPAWTEAGHRFAWRMMLRSKSGGITYYIDVKDETKTIVPSKFLTRLQDRKLPTRPDMIWQMAHFLKTYYEDQGYQVDAVRAEAYVSLNGRDLQPYTDPAHDLLDDPPVPWALPDWLLPRQP